MALWEKKKTKRRMSNALIFLLAFIVFLLVFGGLCLWAVVKINEERLAGESSGLSPAGRYPSRRRMPETC